MKVYQVEIEQIWTALVAANSKEDAERYVSRNMDSIISEAMEPDHESVYGRECMAHDSNPVYCEDASIETVGDARRKA
jgi:hypothetical protein